MMKLWYACGLLLFSAIMIFLIEPKVPNKGLLIHLLRGLHYAMIIVAILFLYKYLHG